MDLLLKKIEAWRKEGKIIVFTNGVFDILHKGHVDYLNASSRMGDILVVGINSDLSVKRLKGDKRPINPELDRAYIVKNLKCVAETVIFEEDTPYNLISAIIPDVLVKGGDYDENEIDKKSPRYIVGSDVVKSNGGRVVTISLTEGKSTTGIINKMKSGGK